LRAVTLAADDDFEGWRDAARALAQAHVAPPEIVWRVGEGGGDLFAAEAAPPPPPASGAQLRVPKAFVQLAQTVLLHSDPQRFSLLYTLLATDPHRIEDRADPLVRRLELMAKAVRRDIHKMRAFVRFRELVDDAGPRFIAWFEPEHHIVRANARFFVERFASMRWSILTPELSIHWDEQTLSEGPAATRGDAPADDPVEAVWKTYYASIFNPARLKTGAMLKEMPRKYWKNMPETALVKELVAGARAREMAMVETARTSVGGNVEGAWEALRDEAAACTRCPLYKPATQTVFGEGPLDADMVLVGEQPGDQEDLAGRAFVGPAGQMLNRALDEAGIDRARVYVTNAVKHFKFEPRGKRRIHAKPDAGEITACRWWYEQELALVRPKLVVALGATAARQITGKAATISRLRGQKLALPEGGTGWVTVHPSYLLRLPDADAAAQAYQDFVADLRGAWALLG